MLPRIDEFHHPWILLLAVPALGLLWWSAKRRRTTAAVVFPSVLRLKGLRPTLRQRLRWVVPALQAIAVLGLILAAARPRQGDARTVVRSEGVAIAMVLDRSGSMEEEMRYRNRMQKKIDIVKDVFVRFLEGGESLPGRGTDLVGLTTFARFTEESCPLVTLHEPLITTVKNLTTVAPYLDQFDQPTWNRSAARQINPLNATAIGDGLKRAVLSLVTAEEDLARGEEEGGYKIQSKVVILLTDGQNNQGMDPVEAGRYAAANDIKVYYILFSEPVERVDTIFGPRVRRRLSTNEVLEEPRKVVEPTGGKAYLAADGDELLRIYEEIDRLERSEIGRIEFKSYHEVYRIFLIPAIAAAVLGLVLKETFFRSIP